MRGLFGLRSRVRGQGNYFARGGVVGRDAWPSLNLWEGLTDTPLHSRWSFRLTPDRVKISARNRIAIHRNAVRTLNLLF